MGVAEVLVTLFVSATAPQTPNLNPPPAPAALSPALNFQVPTPTRTTWRAPWLSQTDPRQYPMSAHSGGHGSFHMGHGGHAGGGCHGGGHR
jgi:hypothetical protein